MLRPACVTVLLAACAPEPPDSSGFIAPMDGQDAVSPEAVLRIIGAARTLPPGADLPAELIRVVDVERGGRVPGRVGRIGDDIVFRPRSEWRPDAGFHWNITEVRPQARSTAFALEAPLAGDAVFSTRQRTRALEAVSDGPLCLVLSQALDDLRLIQSTLAGEQQPIAWELISEAEVTASGEQVDAPVSIACSDINIDGAGDWVFTVDGEPSPPIVTAPLEEVLRTLRHESGP